MILKNKGMFLETLIDNWCQEIKNNENGLINKIPVNYKLVEVNHNVITGLVQKNDNCDYIGIFQGSYIEFDAKETEKDVFPMQNLKKHQKEKLLLVSKCGGFGFLLIYFHSFDRFFLVNIKKICEAQMAKIPLSWFCENGIEVFLSNLSLQLTEGMRKLMIS